MDINVIREAVLRQPFQPFFLRLADRRALEVRHREFVAVGRRRVIVINPQDEATSILEPLLIVSVEYAEDGHSSTGGQDGEASS
jgi:hypothetical protein